MDLFELVATLNLDTTSFISGITGALSTALGYVKDFSVDVVKTGMGFESGMAAVRAVMGLTDDTAENIETVSRLSEHALELARDSIFTAEETTTAYYYMGMAGWDANEAMAGLAGVMDLAAASGEDLKLTSDMVTDSLTAFGLGAGQASHFADVLAVTATNANTDVARMQQTFKYLAPIAGQLGYTMEDVAISVGLIANAGIKGTQAGTTLRNVFTRIATNAGATSKDLGALQIVADELGVSFYDANGRARPWLEVLTEMRAAWRTLDPSKADEVTAAFGTFSSEAQSADDVMTEFASDLDEWTTEWNSLTTATERESFAANLEPQFAALGVSMRDSNGNLREFSEVAKDARVVLGGLTDQEQMSYAKQIGSLRGISGFLQLMTATEDDVNRLTEAVYNADGAAKAMADTRLDSLDGDVKLLNSSFDVLKNTLYEDVKNPMRDVVQYAASAIDRIRDSAKEGGITGFITQIGTEIRAFSDEYKDEIEELASSLVPILSTIFTTIAPALVEAAVTLGIAIGKGIIKGIEENLPQWAMGFLGIKPGEVASSAEVYAASLVGPEPEPVPETAYYDGIEIPVDILAQVDPEQLRSNIQTAIDNGTGYVEIDDGYIVSTDAANQLATDVENGLYSAGQNGASDVEAALSSVGPTAGSNIAADIQSELNRTNFSVNVTGFVQTVFGGISSGWTAERHARSMFGGSILRGATVFGMNSDGRPMVGGAEGPEAVVGTGSLDQMIRSSVSGAMGNVLSRLDTMVSRVTSYSPKFYLDTGALVGGTVNGMNRELNNVAVWKGFGRA